VLHFPYLAEPSLPDDELVIEMALFDLIFIHLLAYFISLLLQGCFYTHWLILRYTDEIVDDGLMHKAFNDVILFCQQTLASSSGGVFILFLIIMSLKQFLHLSLYLMIWS
jgi:hypothetical protein